MKARLAFLRYEKAGGIVFLSGLLIYILACVLSPVSWSPDGRWIALTRYLTQERQGEGDSDVTGSEVWIVSPSPIVRRQLIATSGSLLSAPGWTRDGKSLYVTEYVDVEDSSTPTRVRRMRIVMNGEPLEITPVEAVTTDSVSLWEIPLEGKPRRILSASTSGDTGSAALVAPAMSPDGQRIAFAQNDSAVVLARRDGHVERLIELDKPSQVSWSPDGKWLAVTRADEGEAGPRVLLLDPKTSQTLFLDPDYATIAWLPDGEHLLATSIRGEGDAEEFSVSQLRINGGVRKLGTRTIDIKDSPPLLLDPKSSCIYLGREQKDDQLAAITRIDLRDGDTKVVYESAATAIAYAVSPNGRSLAFREGTPGEETSLESVVGVLDLKAMTEPLFLAVDDKQWAFVLDGYVNELGDVKPESIEPEAKARISVVVRRLDTFLASFRRDFPRSPLLPKYEKAIRELQGKLRKAGIGVAPGDGRMMW